MVIYFFYFIRLRTKMIVFPKAIHVIMNLTTRGKFPIILSEYLKPKEITEWCHINILFLKCEVLLFT